MTVKEEMPALAISQALSDVFQIIRRTVPKMRLDFPNLGQSDLTYSRSDDRNWVEGFWTGQLWLAFSQTQDTFFFDAARSHRPYFIKRLERQETLDHDLGFLYMLSQVADYKLTGDQTARMLGLRAAEILVNRYKANGHYLLAWNEWVVEPSPEFRERKRGKLIIDCMENLSLLFWASKETGLTHYYNVAVEHALTTLKYAVRPDGSTYHSFNFEPQTGQPLGGETVQGYADESCWSRGQAWAIHGFAVTYAYTKMPAFLEAALRTADYAIAHLPTDYIAEWDYRLPADVPHYRDTSAAAIMAAGLFLLADLLGSTNTTARGYREIANLILANLVADYTTVAFPQAEGLLVQGCPFVKKNLSNNMLPYGDYFYVESLLRASGQQSFFW